MIGFTRLSNGLATYQSPFFRARLKENIGAASVRLSPDDLRELESAASKLTVHGARHPEHLQRLVGR